MKQINALNAPEAIGPYCHCMIHENIAFLSGQIPLDPKTMEILGSDIEEQTTQVFENIKAVLSAIDADLDQVVKTTVFLSSMDDFPGMNAVYEKQFKGHKPARSTIEVSKLPKNALLEIECIAAVK